MIDRETLALAYHEAGHACVGELLHLPMKAVTIVSGSYGSGRCVLSAPIGRLPVQKVATWWLAGPEGERHFRNGAPARLGIHDYALARELLECTAQPGEDVDAIVARCELRARALVICHSKWIEVVAKQLLVEKSFRADVVVDLREAAI